MRGVEAKLLLIPIMVFLFKLDVEAHTSCSNLTPLEEVAEPEEVIFCGDYQPVRCCSVERERMIRLRYLNLTSSATGAIPETLVTDCSHHIRDLMCGECNPFSNHIMSLSIRAKYGHNVLVLDHDYCMENLYGEKSCHRVLPHIFPGLEEISENSSYCLFQEEHIAPAYRFPALKKAEDLALNQQNNVKPVKVANDSVCLCFLEIVSSLDKPVELVPIPSDEGEMLEIYIF